MSERLTEKKKQIVEKAVELFSQKGFENTSIEDITNSLGMAKGTLYLYYKSKRDLLLDCIGRLTTMIVPKEVWENIRGETDFKMRHQKRLEAFLRAFPTFCGILDIVNASFQSNDQRLAKKASETFRLLASPIIRDIHWAINHGIARPVNEEITAYCMLGMGEGLGNVLKIHPEYSVEMLAETASDFLMRGIGSQAHKNGVHPHILQWELIDSNDCRVHLRNIRFNEKGFLPGKYGRGALRVFLKNIVSLTVTCDENSCSVSIIPEKGNPVVLSIDGTIMLSGETDMGLYSIPMNHVKSLVLSPDPDFAGEKHPEN